MKKLLTLTGFLSFAAGWATAQEKVDLQVMQKIRD
jgi:hypothetical protein